MEDACHDDLLRDEKDDSNIDTLIVDRKMLMKFDRDM